MRKASVVALAAAVLAATAAATATSASSPGRMLVGIYDEGMTLYSDPATTFPLFRSLRAQVIRLNLHWGGPSAVAKRRPINPTDPNDSAYDWAPYDRIVQYAASDGIQILFSVIGTPAWENGGAGWNRAPANPRDLQDFALAAATRYSGTWTATDGSRLGSVHLWVAWNEPNNPVFLRPQYRRAGKRWVVQSAIDYAKICTAVYKGIHASGVAGEKVGCGVTAPRGNNNPRAARSSVAPLVFLAALHAAGLKRFDAWAHHPYAVSPSETPSTAPRSVTSRASSPVTLGNIGTLVTAVTRDWGAVPIWITEYGYQTNPPDRFAGVSWAKQATYLTEAFSIARKNPRITLMLWFLLRDEPALSGWQSGLETVTGKHKPAYAAFQRLPR